MFLTYHLFGVERKAACSFIEPSIDLIPLHASNKKESDLSQSSIDKNKNLIALFSSSLSAHLSKSCTSISAVQKKYYTNISQHFFFTKALCGDFSLKFQNYPFVTCCDVNVVEKNCLR